MCVTFFYFDTPLFCFKMLYILVKGVLKSVVGGQAVDTWESTTPYFYKGGLYSQFCTPLESILTSIQLYTKLIFEAGVSYL